MGRIHMGSDATLVTVASIPPRIWEQDKETWKAWYLSLKAKPATKQTYKRVIAEFYCVIEKPILQCEQSDLMDYESACDVWDDPPTNTLKQHMRIIRAYWTFAKQQVPKTCQDFEAENGWDTSLCCAYCHGDYQHGSDHEMHAEQYQGQAIWVCIPLYEQLFCGAAHFCHEESGVSHA